MCKGNVCFPNTSPLRISTPGLMRITWRELRTAPPQAACVCRFTCVWQVCNTMKVRPHLRHVSLSRGGRGRNDGPDGGPERHHLEARLNSLRLDWAGLTLTELILINLQQILKIYSNIPGVIMGNKRGIILWFVLSLAELPPCFYNHKSLLFPVTRRSFYPFFTSVSLLIEDLHPPVLAPGRADWTARC